MLKTSHHGNLKYEKKNFQFLPEVATHICLNSTFWEVRLKPRLSLCNRANSQSSFNVKYSNIRKYLKLIYATSRACFWKDKSLVITWLLLKWWQNGEIVPKLSYQNTSQTPNHMVWFLKIAINKYLTFTLILQLHIIWLWLLVKMGPVW